MTLLQMSYILEVDRCGSINRAAQNLFVSQSALSSAIAEVERELGITIFHRSNRGIALTRERLIHDVWGYDFYGDDRTLDTHIKLLRKSLERYSRCIITLRGVGYRFETIAEPEGEDA